MNMEAFVISVEKLFLIDKEKFSSPKDKYIIPKYQREYAWTEERVQALISDIDNRDKFLGNLMLNEVSTYYEIVDGQQRITTLLLILIALFNKRKTVQSDKLNEEQKDILRFIYKDNNLNTVILENESIGQYIYLEDNEIKLRIDETADIYYQKETFERLYQIISDKLDSIKSLEKFQNKLLDCTVLVLVGKVTLNTESIEDVFLDINFKSQLLNDSDIFKGYCFKNCKSRKHNELNDKWIIIRKNIKAFEINIGYDESKKTCQYIYHYLLSFSATQGITENLSPAGKHYLDGKDTTEVFKLLNDMGEYGDNIIKLYKQLDNSTYCFEDICGNVGKYKTDEINRSNMKKMFKELIGNKSAQYYKLPIFMFIHYLYKHKDLQKAFTYEDMKKFITNYYIYAFSFINGKKRKSKDSIDRTILNELYKFDEGKPAESVVSNMLAAVKDLRKKYMAECIQEFAWKGSFNSIRMYRLYSFMDNYTAKDNYIKLIYNTPKYTDEHFLVHTNKNCNVDWYEDKKIFTFSLKELLGEEENDVYKVKNYKKRISNYIIIPQELNGDFGQRDIVTKIIMIRDFFDSLPNHINVFIKHIEAMKEYQKLKECKGKSMDKIEIQDLYKTFIEAYFNEENQKTLYDALERELYNSFKN